jgi:hypothetical protein
MRRRGTAVAIALLGAALATAGCGFGPGSGVGEVSLTVTRDYGERPLRPPLTDGASEADTVMRVLDRNADISTRYGGGFVQSIDGVEAEERFGRSSDWFFYVNGVESTVGAADYPLRGGEAIWWDYRDWTAAMRVPAVVGSWPEPFTGGYEGKRRPVAVECRGGGSACAEVRERLAKAGARVRFLSRMPRQNANSPGKSAASSPAEGAIRVLVGPWERLRQDPAAGQLEDGPQASGVFADFATQTPGSGPQTPGSAVPSPHIRGQRNSGGWFGLVGLDQEGEVVRAFGPGAGLVAATRRYDAPPTWVVTGATAAGVRAAAGLLDAADLRDHYAVAVEDGAETPLPVR